MSSASRLDYRHEDEVDGIVASVFRDVRSRMAFVPALFKALAPNREALVSAWLQARALYDDPLAGDVADRLRERATPRLGYRPAPAVRETVRPFVDQLPVMLLIVTSLGLTLDGELPRRPRPPLDLPEPGPVPLPDVSDRGEHELFAEIRAVYGTEHVPSLFRALAARGVLEEPWRAIRPFHVSDPGLELVAALEEAADVDARRFPEVACFDADSVRPVLDQFRRALPRTLVFATACAS